MKRHTDLIAALDVGTTKLCCLLARIEAGGRLRIVGMGHQVSHGVKSGAIVDMDAVETAIRDVVANAEQMAGETIGSVLVNLAGGRPASRNFHVEVEIGGHRIGDNDLKRVFERSQIFVDAEDREIIHSIPVNFTVDDNRNIAAPEGMFGERLGVNMHVISAGAGAVRNLAACVERSHLDVERFVIAPYASGLACLLEDEMKLGVTLIDMGGGTTSIAIFVDGNVLYTDSVPVGGQHVTNDVAHGLSTSLADAERIKTLYGSCIASPLDERESVDVPPIGEEEHVLANHVKKSALVGIIRPRLEETFELVRNRLNASGFERFAGRRVVLTGGAAQLQGARELAGSMLDRQVRLGRPKRLAGLAEAMAGPAFATAVGLIQYATDQCDEAPWQRAPDDESNGVLRRLGSWLKENF